MSITIDTLTQNIAITKGDRQAITFTNNDGTEYAEFTADDILTLSVKKSIKDEEYVFQAIGTCKEFIY